MKSFHLSNPPILKGYNFTPEDARKARYSNRLLTMRTETSLRCNLRCKYCNGTSGNAPKGEISFNKIKNTISQVKELGGKSVVIIGGGEPTMFPKFRNLIEYINQKNMIPVVITNTTTMTLDLARFLYENNTSVLTKMDSLKEKVQDFLADKKGTFKKIHKGIDNLLNSGYDSDEKHELRLGASFVVNSLNLHEIPDIWKYCRDRNMYPNLEALVPRGRAIIKLSELTPKSHELNNLKRKLLDMDEDDYGYTWLVHAPLTGNGCLQHMYSIYLTTKGFVRPCADVDIELYNVNDMTVKEIINSPFFNYARNIENKLEGKCGKCEYVHQCIGCRGIAFSTGINEGLSIYEAIRREDPLCKK
jgi:radical SAM protein with 4Fe4S-binding SPASM domain